LIGQPNLWQQKQQIRITVKQQAISCNTTASYITKQTHFFLTIIETDNTLYNLTKQFLQDYY